VKYFVTVAVALVVLSPLARSPRWDSFPISSFPMFSRGDLGNVMSLSHVLAVDTEGRRAPVAPALVGSPEPMIAMAIAASNIERGAASELCRRVAERRADAVAIEVVTSTYDMRSYFVAHEPIARTVHARCSPERP
jgi:hypothetical protein